MRGVLAIVATCALTALTACAGGTGAAPGGGGAGFVGGDEVTIVAPSDRHPAPTLEGPTLTGETISTEQFKGKVIVVNVWGSWCAPCRAEAPELVKASSELGESVAFLGLNTRENDQGPALAFERAFGVTYPSIYDPDGKLLLVFGQLPPKAIPSTVVIDADGRVAARVLGAVDAKTLVGIVGDVTAGS